MPVRGDITLGKLIASLNTAQASYLSQHGGYWQGIKTHNTPPADGAKIAPSQTARLISESVDEKGVIHRITELDWADVGIALPATMDVSVEVHVYNGPLGKGYVVIGEEKVGQKVYRKVVNVGPETWRSSDWQEVKEAIL